MAREFVLSAVLKIQVPSLTQIRRDIQKELNAINVKVKLRSPDARQINTVRDNIKNKLSRFNVVPILSNAKAGNIAAVSRDINKELQKRTNLRVRVGGARDLSNLGKTASQTGSSIKFATNSVEDFGSKTLLALKRFSAFTVGAVGVFSLLRSVQQGIADAIEFQNVMVRIAQVTGGTVESVRGVSDEVRRLATTFGVSSKELLEASQVLIQAGFSATDTRKALETLAKTDLAPTFDSIADSTEGLIAAMSQFGFSIDDVQGRFGAINKVAAAFAVESGDLITAFRKAGGSFRAAGGELEDLLALFTSVRATTRQSADTIANGFNTIFARLQRPTTSKFLEEFGISVRDAEGHFVGARQAIEAISLALANVPTSSQQFSQIIEEIGGFRQLKVVIPLLKQYQVTRQALNIAQRGSTSLDDDLAKSQESLSRQIAKVREEFSKLTAKIADSTSFRTLLDITLQLTRSLIKLTDSLEKVAPLILALSLPSISRVGKRFFRGFSSGRFAGGGLVPGTGDRDSVQALLTPGEFVINKRAVQKIGVDKLKELNSIKFNKGGLVGYQSGGLVKQNLGNIAIAGGGLLLFQTVAREAGIAGEALDNFTSSLISGSTQFLLFTTLMKSVVSAERLRLDSAKQLRQRRNQLFEEEAGLRAAQDGNLTPVQEANLRIRRQVATKNREKLDNFASSIEQLQNRVVLIGSTFTATGGFIKDLALQLKFGRGALGGGLAATGGALLSSGLGAQAGLGVGQGLGAFLGGLRGGAGGAAAGAAKGGPLGVAIGALVGIVFGATSSLSEFKEKIDRIELEDFADKFSKTLEKVGKDQLTASFAITSILSNINTLNNRLINSTGAGRVDTIATINNSLPGLENFLVKLAEGSKSFDEFNLSAAPISKIFAEFSKIPLGEFNDRIRSQIEIQNRQNEIAARINASLENFNLKLIDSNNIVSAFNDAALVADDLSIDLSDLSGTITNTIGAFKGIDINRVFENAISGQTIDSRLFSRSISNAESLFSSLIGSERAGVLSGRATDAANIVSQLSDVLIRIRGRDPLGVGDESLLSAFDEEIRRISQNKEVSNAFTSAAERIDDFNNRLVTDLSGVLKELSGTSEPFIKVFKDSLPVLQDQIDKYSELLATRRKLEQESNDIANRTIDIQRKVLEFESGVNRQDVPVNRLLLLERRRFSNLFPSALQSVNATPENLGKTLVDAQEELQRVSRNIRVGQGGDVRGLEKERDSIIRVIDSTTQALKFLADQTQKTADIEAEINREREKRETRFNFGSDFLFGDDEARRNIARSATLASIAARTGNINAIPSNRRQDVGQFLEQFANVPLAILGGQTGRQTQELLLKNAGLGGANIPGQREQSLIEELRRTFDESIKANDILRRNIDSNIDKFGKTIDQQFTRFLSELRSILLESETRRVSTELGLATNRTSTLTAAQGQLGNLSNILGRQVDTDTLKNLKTNISGITSLLDIRRQLLSGQRLIEDFNGRGGDIRESRIEPPTFRSAFPLNTFTDREGLIKQAEKFKPAFRFAGLDENAIIGNFRKKLVEDGSGALGVNANVIFREVIQDELNKTIPELQKRASDISGTLRIFGKDLDLIVNKSTDIQEILQKLQSIDNIERLNTELANTKNQVDLLTKSLRELRRPVEAQKPVGRAFGGIIPGFGTRDTVPAMLTPGEFVIRKEAVNAIGLDNLFRLNAQGFAVGGPVGFSKDEREKALRRRGIRPGSDFAEYLQTVLPANQIQSLTKDRQRFLVQQFRLDQRKVAKPTKQERLATIAKRRATALRVLNRGRTITSQPVSSPTSSSDIVPSQGISGINLSGLQRTGANANIIAEIRQLEKTFANFVPKTDKQAKAKADNLAKARALRERAVLESQQNIQFRSNFIRRTGRRPEDPNFINRRTGNTVITNKTRADLGLIPGSSPTSGGKFTNIFPIKAAKSIDQQRREEAQAKLNRIRSNERRIEEQPHRIVGQGSNLEQRLAIIGRETQLAIARANKQFRVEALHNQVTRLSAIAGQIEAIKEIEERNRKLRRPGFNKGGFVGFQTGGPVTGSGLSINNDSISKLDNIIKDFAKAGDQLVKSLSTLTFNFEHTVNHTGELHVIGALEASQAISDAVIKRVVPLIDQRISQIEHDASGKHRVRGK